MLNTALLSFAALALLACGWFASSWVHRRRIRELRERLAAVRATAADHANQVKRQIGQLQAELAARPPRRQPPLQPAPSGASEPFSIGGQRVLDEHGFASTEIGPNGFQPTRAMA